MNTTEINIATIKDALDNTRHYAESASIDQSGKVFNAAVKAAEINLALAEGLIAMEQETRL